MFKADVQEQKSERFVPTGLCCEVVEHFHDPAVMTSMEYADVKLASWHYRRDPRHVAFYKPETKLQIGMDRGWQTVIPSRTVVLFKQRL